MIIDKTEHLILTASDNAYLIEIVFDDAVIKIAKIEKDSFNVIDKNLQDCIVTWELYQEFIKLVDEVFDLIKENK